MGNRLGHKPWVGERFDSLGINGEKIAVMAYSHYNDDPNYPDDNVNFTIDTIESVKKCIDNGESTHAFFTKIPSYFGFQDKKEFWDRVLFFNFVPIAVGGSDERYKTAAEDQMKLGRERFSKIIEKYGPAKVVVLTKKGWTSLPEAWEELHDGRPKKLKGWMGSKDYCPEICHYQLRSGDWVTAYGLRHPERANSTEMTRAIKAILKEPLKRGHLGSIG